MTPHVTAISAAILGLWSVLLSNYVSINRGRLKISHGDGGNPQMAVIMRRHGNLMENAPLALILLGFAEMTGFGTMWITALAGILVLVRLVHPFGLSLTNPNSPLRIIGAVGTNAVTLISALIILWMTMTT